jgi:branched-subunit amino acid transport protein
MTLLAILLTGVGTYFSRAIFILLLSERPFPPLALRALEYVAPAVMGALIVSMLTGDGAAGIAIPELGGLACAAVVAWTTRNHIFTLLAGMTTFWLLGAFV